MKRQIIIIPGIMGSKLQYKEFEIWPINPTILWKGANELQKKLKDLQDEEINSEGILENFFGINFYGELVKYSKQLGDEITIFNYDWRKSNFCHIEELKQKINLNADEVIIIAHSMGGIVAKLFLTADIDDVIKSKITKLITLGTPWNGSVEAHLCIEYGLGPALLKGIYSDTIPKFESIYQLLPNEKYIKETEEKFGCSYLNGLNWNEIYKKYYINNLNDNGLNSKAVLENFYHQMEKSLPNNIEHHEIIGYDIATKAMLENVELKVYGRFTSGDGTVPLYGAISETENKYFIQCSHKKLANNKTVNKILEDIIKNRMTCKEINEKHNLKSYEDITKENKIFKVVRVACPVNASLVDVNGEILYGEGTNLNMEELFGIFGSDNSNIQYIDNDIYFILGDKEEKIHVEAYDEGTVSISIDEYDINGIRKNAKFKSFNIDESKSVDIILKDKLEECSVKLKNYDEDNLEAVIIDGKNKLENVELAKTEYKFSGEKFKKIDGRENEYIAVGDVYLNIINRCKGTYDIIDTVYYINDTKTIVREKENVKLKLINGENIIKVYSVDIFNNIEESIEEKIYYIENESERLPKLHINIEPKNYTITSEFITNKMLEKLNLKIPKWKLKFNNNKNILQNYVEIIGVEREFSIEVEDIFGVIESQKYKINESILQEILASKAESISYKKFLEGLGIDIENMKRYKVSREGQTNSLKNINKNRLSDADKIEFKNSIVEISIDKKKMYGIRFSNLREYIQRDENNDYVFEFSVFEDKKEKSTELELDIILATEVESRVSEYYELEPIEYNFRESKYRFTINSRHINMLLLSDTNLVYDDITRVLILISLKDEMNTRLRVCELEIK